MSLGRKKQGPDTEEDFYEPLDYTPSSRTHGQSTIGETPAQSRGEAHKRSLFVRSLPASATTEDLTKLFSQSYPLKHAIVISNPTTHLSKGYGFVTFTDPSDASAALQTFDGALFDGQKIKVELAEPRLRGFQATNVNGRTLSKLSSTPARIKARHGQQQAPHASSQLIIRNLPWTITTSEQLAMLFRSYGKVKRAIVPKKQHGLAAGFGFVLLRGRKNAEKAMLEVNGKVVDGRTLAVDWAVPKDVWESLHQSKKPNSVPEEPTSVDGQNPEAVGKSTKESGGAEHTSKGDHIPDAASTVDIEGTDSIDDTVADDTATSRSKQDNSSTLFIRNVPFTVTDEVLSQHFASFGPVRYARVVLDSSTQRSKGTAFICFWNQVDAMECLRAAPKTILHSASSDKQAPASNQFNKTSILEDIHADTTGRFTIDGRVLQLSRAVDRDEATRLMTAGHTYRDVRDRDKRRLYLLSEGTIPSNSPLYNQLAPAELTLREESARQRQTLIKNNPALHLSLTRLSVRNLPRSATSKELKALAREAVVGFSRDVKAGLRQALSKEELSRAGDAMREAERARKAKGKGIVKQSKVVFESSQGRKVAESSGAGRSKGYGFIEYTSHRWALMGLRWLNGHTFGSQSKSPVNTQNLDPRKRRLIVEFAIENAQVVGRRRERESQSQSRPRSFNPSKTFSFKDDDRLPAANGSERVPISVKQAGSKRKRAFSIPRSTSALENTSQGGPEALERLAKKQKIIGRKRMSRKARKLR
ncbi:MAG: hypothetical protein Q9201_004919 [Fulgogasparrea decipioides]